MGIDPNVQALFMQGSQIFRQYDRDYSGQLDRREFAHAMRGLGLGWSEYDCNRLFAIADTDRSGRISEREFCEFWVYLKRGGYIPASSVAVGAAMGGAVAGSLGAAVGGLLGAAFGGRRY